jgi:hypothetical protein
VLRRRGQLTGVEEDAGDDQQNRGQDLSARDHRLAPDRVEEAPQQQGPGEVARREREQVEAHARGVDAVELRQDQRVCDRHVVGAFGGPLLFGALIESGEAGQIFVGCLVGAAVMIFGGTSRRTWASRPRSATSRTSLRRCP